MRVILLAFLTGWLATVALAKPPVEKWRLSPIDTRDAVRAAIEGQIAALRAGKFDAACEFAASGIRRQFKPAVFAAMLKRGYPVLLDHRRYEAGLVRDDREGRAQVVCTFIDARAAEHRLRYTLVIENGRWLIESVAHAAPEREPGI